MSSKICFKCGEDKPLSAYYKHKQMGDGHLNKCKDCTKKDVREREDKLKSEDLDGYLESEKERSREKYYRLNYRIKNRNKPSSRGAAKSKSMKKYEDKYPEKAEARRKSSHITIKGKEKHHWSYNENHAEDVIPLTTKQHKFLHRYIEYDQERYMYRAVKSVGEFVAGELLDTKYRHIKYFILCTRAYIYFKGCKISVKPLENCVKCGDRLPIKRYTPEHCSWVCYMDSI